MKRDCRKIQMWLIQSVDEALPEGKQSQLEAHLQHCAACREFRDALQASQSLFEAERDLPVPELLKRRVQAGIEIRLKSQNRRKEAFSLKTSRPAFFPRAALAAAALVFVFFVGQLFLQNKTPQRSLDVPGAVQSAVVVESAQYLGQPANLSIFESPDKKVTFIWIN